MLEAACILLFLVVVLLSIMLTQSGKKLKASKSEIFSLNNQCDRLSGNVTKMEDLYITEAGKVAKYKKSETKTASGAMSYITKVLNNKARRKPTEVSGLKYSIKLINSYINSKA